MVRIKGAEEPVAAHRLLGIGERHHTVGRAESTLVGRRWEMSTVEGLLDPAIDGHGSVVGVVGPPGIGKSRLVRELSAMASPRGVEVFTTFCVSHASQIPFHAIARLLRVAFGVEGLDGQTARDRVRDRIAEARRRTCCSLMTCLASPIPMWSCRRSIRCSSAAVDGTGECCIVGPQDPGGLCR